ncbi:MAG: hypothetical protein WCK53_08950 [Methanomicrobiales archaeon]
MKAAPTCTIALPTNRTNTVPLKPTTASLDQPASMNGRPVFMESETVIKNVAVRPDSLELGTPGKSGCIKIYFDASDVADAELRIRNAITLRDLANNLTSYPTPIAQAGKVHA